MNNYFLEGSDVKGRSIEIDKIISKEGFKDASTSIYDLESNDLSDVLEDLDTYGLFSDKKVIIIRNIDLFKIDDNKDKYDHFIKYLNNYDKDKLLFVEIDSLNGNSKLSKDKLEKNGFDKLPTWQDATDRYCKELMMKEGKI